ncbi:MAG: DUF4403 family protein [Polyangiaceae bacterium]|nr:DUF4403 family protein [Polyangiaceae bacterium]
MSRPTSVTDAEAVSSHWRALRNGALLLGLLLGACRTGPASGPSPAECTSRGSEPRFDVPSPVGAVPSEVTVELVASTAWLEAKLESEVPVVLAQGEQSAGIAGRVRFGVRRGSFDIALAERDLVVTTPVDANVTVCKPIAGFCPVLGRCAPRLAVTATVPVVLDEHYGIGSSKVTTQLVRGCRILGLDVSGEVARRAAQEASGVKRRIDKLRPDLRPWVQRGWERAHQPISLGLLGCLRLRPEGITQRAPELREGLLSTALTVSGSLSLDPTCPERSDSADPPDPPPELRLTEQARETRLELPIRVRWDTVSGELGRALAAGKHELTVTGVHAGGVAERGAARVLVALTVTGACDKVWMTAEPLLDTAENQVRLRDIRAVSGFEGGMDPEQLERLGRRLKSTAAISVAFDPKNVQAALPGLVEHSLDLPEGMSVDFDLKPTEGRVLLDSDGLVPVLGLKGRVMVRLR